MTMSVLAVPWEGKVVGILKRGGCAMQASGESVPQSRTQVRHMKPGNSGAGQFHS